MREFRDYDINYPDLIISILDYFSLSKGCANEKNVLSFCKTNPHPDVNELLQPEVVAKICDILCDKGFMSRLISGTPLGINNNYCYVQRTELSEPTREAMIHYLNSSVYGFEYVYRFYSDKVLPIIAYKDENQQIGSCFKYRNGIVTAKHCLVDGDCVAIRGYKADILNQAQIYISNNEYVDIAYIDLGQEQTTIFTESPAVLDDVLVMGYPMIPRFLNFLTVEKASISSIANTRFAPSRGVITAIADEMFTCDTTPLMLITARITGGNSGGPIINRKGSVVGVAVSDTISEGETYDELGYGVATPITDVLDRIITDGKVMNVKFKDYHE